MVGYDGEKMSKSKGNLVRVSDLRRAGVDPMAIRLVLLDQHYRTPWEYTAGLLDVATKRWDEWSRALQCGGDEGADALIDGVRAALANDLDSPAAVRLVDGWAAGGAAVGTPSPRVADALDALLGHRSGAPRRIRCRPAGGVLFRVADGPSRAARTASQRRSAPYPCRPAGGVLLRA